jgi:hypothetical protein
MCTGLFTIPSPGVQGDALSTGVKRRIDPASGFSSGVAASRCRALQLLEAMGSGSRPLELKHDDKNKLQSVRERTG